MLFLGFVACNSSNQESEQEVTQEETMVATPDNGCGMDQVKLENNLDTFEFDMTYSGDFSRITKTSATQHGNKNYTNDAANTMRFVYQPESSEFIVYLNDQAVETHNVLLATDESRSELDKATCEYILKSRRTVIKGGDGFEFSLLKNINGIHLNTVENAPFRFNYSQNKKVSYSNNLKYNPGPSVTIVQE
jgi:hypothetical protein